MVLTIHQNNHEITVLLPNNNMFMYILDTLSDFPYQLKKTLKIQYGGVRSEKYLANSFCDTLASINLIYVCFVIIHNQETGRKNVVPDTEPFQ